MTKMNECPHEIFAHIYEGLTLFLSQYPYMDSLQQKQIKELIEYFARPSIRRNIVRRPALLCKADQDGTLTISPHFLPKSS